MLVVVINGHDEIKVCVTTATTRLLEGGSSLKGNEFLTYNSLEIPSLSYFLAKLFLLEKRKILDSMRVNPNHVKCLIEIQTCAV